MSYLYNVPNYTAGIDQVLVQTQESINIFIPMFLFFIWCMIFLGGIMAQKRRSVYIDSPVWATLSSIVTLIIALPLTLVVGLVQLEWLVIIVIMTMLSGLWLFLDKNRSEV